jgi:hypothetical protein
MTERIPVPDGIFDMLPVLVPVVTKDLGVEVGFPGFSCEPPLLGPMEVLSKPGPVADSSRIEVAGGLVIEAVAGTVTCRVITVCVETPAMTVALVMSCTERE